MIKIDTDNGGIFMDALQIAESIDSLFDINNKELYLSESGLTYQSNRNVNRVGYCVNLTLDTIEKAQSQGVDMIITHHPAWDEIFGLKEACTSKLREYGMSHYYNHLPLDDCDFGTNDTLIRRLNLRSIKRTHEWEGLYFGRVGEPNMEMEFEQLVKSMEYLLEEPVKAWKFNDKKVSRVGLVCGNGGSTECIKESLENGCDVYITGERDLYTVQYAMFKGINLIVGSHTFTEILGVDSLVGKASEILMDIEFVRIDEGHYEVNA